MQKKLRIAIVCDAIDDTNQGGSFISGKRFGAGLAKAGHDIVWITGKFSDQKYSQHFAYAKLYHFPRLPRLGAYGIRFAYTSVARLMRIFQQEQIDIIYSIQPTILSWQAVRAAKRLHIPIVSHSHTLPESFVPGAPTRIQRIIKKIVVAMYKTYDGIVSPTEFLQQKYPELEGKKQVVIGNGVDTSIFCPGPQQEHPFTLVYVGRLDHAKNLTFLLQALQRLKTQEKLHKDIRCMIVGGGSIAEELHSMTYEYGLQHHVIFTGKIPAASPRLVQIYQQASVFVLPSLYETEGMVVLEAMACGCPLLIADSPTSAAKQFVQDNGYTFAIDDPQDLADKIYTLYTHPEICELMSKVSSKQALQFTFEQSVKHMETFLQSFIHTQEKTTWNEG